MNNPIMGGGLLPGSAVGILNLDPSVNQRRHPPACTHLHPIPVAGGLDSDHQMASLLAPSSAGAATSDDEDYFPAATGDDDGHDPHSLPDPAAGGSKKASPWHRMKWTDEVVRLLISVVAHVGDHDDGSLDAFDGPAAARRKHGASLQKKGKWKTVSKLMLEKGCYVSPQQCEDKFNDLNKRYKRLNEILGRGTSCQVVENPHLLDSMPHISPKAKDDVRKILSSKHLFYREMCAYHNGQRIPNCHDVDLQACEVPKAATFKDGDGHVDDEDEDEDKDDDNGVHDDRSDEMGKRGFNSFWAEMDGVLQDTTKSPWEQREWFKKCALQLEEERVEIEAEALELEKQHFKWQRFRGKKDRELEKLRLENERLRLENERMILQVRQKELELDIRRSGNPLDSTHLRMDGEQARDPMELAIAQESMLVNWNSNSLKIMANCSQPHWVIKACYLANMEHRLGANTTLNPEAFMDWSFPIPSPPFFCCQRILQPIHHHHHHPWPYYNNQSYREKERVARSLPQPLPLLPHPCGITMQCFGGRKRRRARVADESSLEVVENEVHIVHPRRGVLDRLSAALSSLRRYMSCFVSRSGDPMEEALSPDMIELIVRDSRPHALYI